LIKLINREGDSLNIGKPQHADTTTPHVTREHSIGGKSYIVKSVYIGTQDIQTSLLNLAERKAVREMGLEMPLKKIMQN
jgi:D-arabinose 1-dehydrogenase-like Zn-dependent alcohol dehydrogenase